MKHLLLILALALPGYAQTTRIIGLSDLQNYWPFEDLSGGSTTARYGGVNGTVTNATLVQGLIGSCLSFDGAGDYVTCSTAFRPAFNQNWSVSFWFYDTLVNSAQHLIFSNYNAGASTGIFVGASTGNKLFCEFWTSASAHRLATAPTTISASVWHFGVVTWSGTTISAYIDTAGASNSSTTGSPGSFAYSVNTVIGRYDPGANQYWNGKIDDLKCYNHAMTQGEISYLFNCKRQAVR